MALATAISFAACADKSNEIVEEETQLQKPQAIEIDAEELTIFSDKDAKPEDAAVAGTRIVYVDSQPGEGNYPGLSARWQFKPTGSNQIQDKAEFYLRGVKLYKGNWVTAEDKVVGRLINVMPYDPDKKNVGKFITVVNEVNLTKPLFYCSVTGSGIADNRSADQILNWKPTYTTVTINKPQYLEFRDNATPPLIKTQHVTTDRIMNLTNNYEYNTNGKYLKKSIIQVVSGNVNSGNYIFMRYRPIVMLINLELKNSTANNMGVKKIELNSATTYWAYDMNHSSSRYDPQAKAMTTGSPKTKNYIIYDRGNGAEPQFAPGTTLNSYQVAIPAVASVNDLVMKITFSDNTVKTIDFSGEKTLAAGKRIKIKRTWNGNSIVKE